MGLPNELLYHSVMTLAAMLANKCWLEMHQSSLTNSKSAQKPWFCGESNDFMLGTA